MQLTQLLESLFRQRRAYNSLLVNFDLKITASPGHYSPRHYSPVNNVSIISPLVTIVVVTLHKSAKICLSYSWNYGSLTLSYLCKTRHQLPIGRNYVKFVWQSFIIFSLYTIFMGRIYAKVESVYTGSYFLVIGYDSRHHMHHLCLA